MIPDYHSVDKDHIVLLEKIDKLILASEAEEVGASLKRRMKAIRGLLVIHASKTTDIKDQIAKSVETNRKKFVILGIALPFAIFIPYFLVTRTSLLSHHPIECKVFETKDHLYPGEIEICINGITHAYSPQNGDVELDITFLRSPTERLQVDAVFWIADQIAGRPVDYVGEYNIDRVRVYDKGLLVKDDKEKVSGWLKPLVPRDVQIPLWHWIHHCRDKFYRHKKPFEESLEKLMTDLGAVIATAGSVGITAYRFIRARL